MSGGQSRVESPNTRYSAIANEKSTMSQSKKSIAFTPNQAQFCEIGTLTGSHPAGFLYSVDVTRYAMACPRRKVDLGECRVAGAYPKALPSCVRTRTLPLGCDKRANYHPSQERDGAGHRSDRGVMRKHFVKLQE